MVGVTASSAMLSPPRNRHPGEVSACVVSTMKFTRRPGPDELVRTTLLLKQVRDGGGKVTVGDWEDGRRSASGDR